MEFKKVWIWEVRIDIFNLDMKKTHYFKPYSVLAILGLFSILGFLFTGCDEFSLFSELGKPIPSGAGLPSLTLAIKPDSATVYVGEVYIFSASGGVPPYTYAVVEGGGTVDSSTGVYTAPDSVGSAIIRVTDSASNTSEASVSIVDYPYISSPPERLYVYDEYTFEASGGVSPYTYSIIDGIGTLDSSTGVYNAPGYSGEVDIEIKDSMGKYDIEGFNVVWHRISIDTSGNVGEYSSLKIDSSGNPGVAYYDATNGYLKYAYYNGSSWGTTTVDNSNDVGRFASLALDGNGYPCISYYDYTSNDLKYAHYNGSSWNTETIDSAGDVGMYTSIAVDSNNYPRISYYDNSINVLKYVYYDGANWSSPVTVDSAEDDGQYSSLALDSNGYPHISYYDATNQHLKYAYYDGANWHTETVDVSVGVGQYTSIAIDSNNRPHISYYDATNGALKYAYYDGGSWHIETIAGNGVGEYTSLVLDSGNSPHIAFYDAANGDLKYAFKRDSSWVVDTVDSRYNVGKYASVAIYRENGEERVAFSCYDDTNGNLKFAY